MVMDEKVKAKEAWRIVYPQFCETKIKDNSNNLQNIFTPYDLCYDMVRKLESYTGDLKCKTFCIFNLEFAEILCYDFGIPLEWMLFVTDCKEKIKFAQLKRYTGLQTELISTNEFLEGKWDMKFDCVIMNPPYQSDNKRSPLWQKFVKKAFELVKTDGFICAIHPCSWRKPDHALFNLFKAKQLKHLEIHSQKDGIAIFGCGTRYDWYILKNSTGINIANITDENGVQQKINISEKSFIPHVHSSILEKCLAKDGEEKCNVMHSRSMYGNDKSWISKKETEIYKYPCIYSTPCNKEPNLLYSSKKDGHFGIKKVIIGKASPENAYYDKNGKYGVSNNCFAIKVDNDEEADGIITVIKSNKFDKIIQSCKWAGFAIEYKMFKSFRKDFWKDFI